MLKSLNKGISTPIAVTIIIVLVVIIAVGILTWQYFGTPKEEVKTPGTSTENYCEKDEDCDCGVNINTGNCFYGNKDYVDITKQCPDFCTGITGQLMIKCINNECNQVSE